MNCGTLCAGEISVLQRYYRGITEILQRFAQQQILNLMHAAKIIYCADLLCYYFGVYNRPILQGEI